MQKPFAGWGFHAGNHWALNGKVRINVLELKAVLLGLKSLILNKSLHIRSNNAITQRGVVSSLSQGKKITTE